VSGKEGKECAALSLLLGVDEGLNAVDARVADGAALTLEDANLLGDAGPRLVEDDVLALVDEGAVAELERRTRRDRGVSSSLRSSGAELLVTHVAVKVDEEVAVPPLVVRAEEFLEGLSGLPGVVVRDLGRDVVGDVGLALFGRQAQLSR
jgi:hypothetical protein